MSRAALKPLDQSVERALLSNQAAFRAFLRKRLASAEEVEDLLQESLLKAVRAKGSLRKYESVTAWFYRVLNRALIDHYRSRASEGDKRTRFAAEVLGTRKDRTPPPDDAYKAVCACMTRLLPTLKDEYADALRRIDLKGESLSQTARSLKVRPATLTVRLHRARQALRKSLERSCGSCAEHACLDCSCRQPSTED